MRFRSCYPVPVGNLEAGRFWSEGLSPWGVSAELAAQASLLLALARMGRRALHFIVHVLSAGTGLPALVLGLLTVACGESGIVPGTIDPGQDFEIAEIVFDENYFYCRVEPVLFRQRCGPGDPTKGDPVGSCHYSVTSYHLTDYAPLVSESCDGLVPGPSAVSETARQNYQTSQSRMKRNPELAPLLTRPTGTALHPRKIFPATSPDADLIRQWATRFSTQ